MGSIKKSTSQLKKIAPDIKLTLGDREFVLAGIIGAGKEKKPVSKRYEIDTLSDSDESEKLITSHNGSSLEIDSEDDDQFI